MNVSVGACNSTVKTTGPLVPPAEVTVTLRVPSDAFAAIVNVAVADVGLPTTTLLTVMPAPALIVIPDTKFVPVNVTVGAVARKASV
jgi:hypothetical protein